jgi:biotin transport system substrate-specific component
MRTTTPAHSTAAARLIDFLWPAEKSQAVLRAVVLMLAGTVILTLSAKINVPFYPVPMTMQTFAVLVIGAVYGARLGAATLVLYLAEGAIGLPVFAGTPEKGIGIPYMMGPTGGYLVGFVLAAWLVGFLADRGGGRTIMPMFAVMMLGHVVIFICGVAWLASLVGFAKAWAFGVAPFYWATLLKTALGAALVPAAWLFVLRR